MSFLDINIEDIILHFTLKLGLLLFTPAEEPIALPNVTQFHCEYFWASMRPTGDLITTNWPSLSPSCFRILNEDSFDSSKSIAWTLLEGLSIKVLKSFNSDSEATLVMSFKNIAMTHLLLTKHIDFISYCR